MSLLTCGNVPQGDVKQILHALTTYNHRSIVSSRTAAEENREGKLPSENTYMDLSNDVMMTPVAAGVVLASDRL